LSLLYNYADFACSWIVTDCAQTFYKLEKKREPILCK